VTVVVYSWIGWRRRKDEDEDNDHQWGTPNLAFHCWTDQIQPIPIDNHIPYDNPDDPE
jgi:hypothetical protein